MERLKWIKGMAVVLCTAAAAWSGAEFYAMRHYKEPVALGPGVTQVQKPVRALPAGHGQRLQHLFP